MAVMYRVYIEPDVHATRQELPGHVRQQVKRIIENFMHDPRPSGSRLLTVEEFTSPVTDVEFRRVRIEHWRVIYAVSDEERQVWVLGVFRRPPYDYDNLKELGQRIN